jgi:type IX secretion system PorP/SprF family membrane protein
MKQFITFFFLFSALVEGFAQQDPLYSQYINNPFVLNPAYAGLTDNLNLSLSYRNQWAGYEGSPKTINANGHLSLFNNKMGAGLMMVSDQIGSKKTNEVMAAYSYRVNVTEGKLLSFGLQAGITNFRIDNSKVNPYDPSDPLYQGNISETKPTIGFGMILKSDQFFIGMSVPRMLKETVNVGGQQATLYTQHFYAMGSYLFFLSDRVRFKPAALLKMISGAPASVDINASLIIYENYQAGLLTRNFNSYGIFLQALVKDKLRFGYVFEMPTGSSVGTNFTTHEITLGLRMNVLSFHSNSSVLSF